MLFLGKGALGIMAVMRSIFSLLLLVQVSYMVFCRELTQIIDN